MERACWDVFTFRIHSERRDEEEEMAREGVGGREGQVGGVRDWWLSVWAIGKMGLLIPTIWDTAKEAVFDGVQEAQV